jgi:Protein of unknown function (DUF2281)
MQMTSKEQLIQELDNLPEPLIVEVLDFLRFLKAKRAEDQEDLADARAALASVKTEGTVTWETLQAGVDKHSSKKRYPLRGVPIQIADDFDAPLPDLWEALGK